MPNITLSISKELKNEMDNFPEVNWSQVTKTAIIAYIEKRKIIDKNQSTVTTP